MVNPEIGPDLSGLPDELAPVVTAMLAHKCADLLRLLGASPARARRALIHETTAKDHPTMVLPQPDAPMLDRLDSFERLLHEESAPAAGNTLASPPGDESETDTVSVREPDPRKASPAEPVPQRGRPPASRRVAEELRERYAARPALAWSKR
ncbi:hypothetical protein [Streptomyces sp. LARHCF252]